MLQAIGLTSSRRRDRPPAVQDLTLEAAPGRVTALLGPPGSGKSTALRLMLGLEPGRGVTYFRGSPLHRVAHPAREVGALLGDVPGHPARTARGQLRMVCAAIGVPAARADEVLEAVGLTGFAGHRLDALSAGADRRLAVACALLGDPQTLILDQPAEGLPPQEHPWWHGLLRTHADRGGTVLCTSGDPREAARFADRVVTVAAGLVVADQECADFSRTRLRPRVTVRTPHAARLAELVRREARASRRSVEAVAEAGGGLLSVYGSTCAEVGETAFRHGVLVHLLTEETGPAPGAPSPPGRGPGARPPGLSATPPGAPAPEPGPSAPPAPAPAAPPAAGPGPPAPAAPPALAVPPAPSALAAPPAPPPPVAGPSRAAGPFRAAAPVRPLRYELLRILGVRTAALVVAAAVLVSLALCVLLARSGTTPLPLALAAWPDALPLPPAALAAGVIGALSFGEEFRHPALATARGTVPRRLGLLLAKLAVTAGAALLTALLVAAADAQALRIVYGAVDTGGPGAAGLPEGRTALLAAWCALAVGCAWAGLLAAGVFRVTAAGVAAVLAVPVVVTPLVREALTVPSARSVAGFPGRLRELTGLRLPREADDWLLTGVQTFAQPVGVALMLSLSVLICAYMFADLRRGTPW
ncbi:ATP-binding cassette domain-containing protein [Streptomyces sp. NPDC001889]